MSSVYIICLDRPLGHARHYVGFAEDVIERILAHADTTWLPFEHPIDTADGRHISGKKLGTGATFMGVVNYHDIRWSLVRVFEGADRAFERKLHNTHSTADYCPRCAGTHVRDYHPLEAR